LDANQRELKNSESLKQKMSENSLLKLKYIPISRENEELNNPIKNKPKNEPGMTNESTEEWSDSKIQRAKDFNDMVRYLVDF
jgi:hypothetical protein